MQQEKKTKPAPKKLKVKIESNKIIIKTSGQGGQEAPKDIA